tara:strand:- start:20893 stop:22473 length:1581 start_codon:yes stop_codon:yes gene_type:complete
VPTVFQTGEREGRPLFPDRIYYTSAQKVADILQIPFPDPIPLAANDGSTYVDIAPADYRLVGFEVGDKIEITSDAEMGEERTITSIARASGNVRLSFSGALTGTYTTAQNADVQNLQSFTNGKRKGVTKAQVETLIKRTQDKIDNLTNNSWRPMLQTAEYLNFDTYKPYRRRYYTDYVGSVPLMFRNAQQILRLEIWQGQDYREIAAAEIRLKISDFTQITADTDKLFLCPGGGGVATLTAGDGNSKFRAQFDNVSTAQQLADLINKDARKGKNAIAFSPSFSFEDVTETDGTITANVHHEFMASANADYGGGQLKITSMRRGEAGENATYACTSSGVTFSGATDTSTTVSSATATTITVADVTGLAPYGIINIGSTYGYYTSITGTTLNGVTDLEGDISAAATNGATVNQKKFKIDYVGTTTGDEARLRDWWADYDLGVIYFNNSYPYFSWNAVKVSYVYGERYVEKAIEDICTKLVAMDLILSDDRSVLLPEGTQNVDLGSKYQLFKAQVAETLPRYTEVMTVL